MVDFKDLPQSADWKSEKHVPVIDCPDTVKKGETLSLELTVGNQIILPNTTEHHIRIIEAYFLPEGEKFPYQLGRFEFNTHGESVQGPNTSTVFSEPKVIVSFKTEKSGTVIALCYCNIHGLWKSGKDIKVS